MWIISNYVAIASYTIPTIQKTLAVEKLNNFQATCNCQNFFAKYHNFYSIAYGFTFSYCVPITATKASWLITNYTNGRAYSDCLSENQYSLHFWFRWFDGL